MATFGTYDVDEQGRRCYRPPTPSLPRLEEVWDQLEPARAAVEAFDHALTDFPVPNVVGKLFARLDAVHSSGAEGTTTTFSDLLGYQSDSRQARDLNDARTVASCAEAFDELAVSGATPIVMALAIHKRLFEDSPEPYARKQAGRWKLIPNQTFDADEPAGVFYYTHPRQVPEALRRWQDLAADAAGPPLLRQAAAHWMFELIHPLGDGNGRIGRLMVPLLLRKTGGAKNACAFLGEAVHLNKDAYIEALKHGRRSGDLTAWSRFCLSMIRQNAVANLKRLNTLGRIHDRWRGLTRDARSHATVHELVPFALTRPVFTVSEAARALGKSFQNVNVAVERMIELGILRQRGLDEKGRNRLFETPEVLAAFEPSRPELAIVTPLRVDPASKDTAKPRLRGSWDRI